MEKRLVLLANAKIVNDHSEVAPLTMPKFQAVANELAAEMAMLDIGTLAKEQDEERFCDEPRNLTMDCSLIKGHGITFYDSIEGIENAIKMPFRTE